MDSSKDVILDVMYLAVRHLIFGASNRSCYPAMKETKNANDIRRRKVYMVNGLKKYFPMLRSREEVLEEIHSRKELREVFQGWQTEQQEEFLDVCTGARGVKILYDSFFKEIMNPDTMPERLEEVLSLLLNQNVKILRVLSKYR